MRNDFIKIRGAKVHNLKNINLDIPRDKLVVITGLSGSGKSSLAFDTIYAEGQRRYVESLSSYVRQFLGVIDKPDVERIDGLSPAISIDQRSVSRNPRSTVGTTTEIYDYLRLLFAKVGIPHCPKCGKKVGRQSVSRIVDEILGLARPAKVTILAPAIKGKKGEFRGFFEKMEKSGYLRVRVDSIIYSIEEAVELELDKNKTHFIEVVIDCIITDEEVERARIVDSVETALRLGDGFVIVYLSNKLKKVDKDIHFNEFFACSDCGIQLPEVSPRLFSFNSPHGACFTCTGLGQKQEIDPELVIPNKSLTLAEGAIKPLSFISHRVGQQNWCWKFILDLSKKYSISLNIPVRELSKEKLNIILYGDKSNNIDGLISQLEKKYRETNSDFMRIEIEKYMVAKKCPVCFGKRLRAESLSVKFAEVSIDKIVGMSIPEVVRFFKNLFSDYDFLKKEKNIIEPIIKEILFRLKFLVDVGLEYVTLDRSMNTLSGGESQRIRLATQIGSGLSGVIYILDEPSIGLHQKDQERLIKTLKELRDIGNTVIVVEHDEQTIKSADWIVDIGPGAGMDGGSVVFEGNPKNILKAKTLTGEYLSGKKKIKASGVEKDIQDKWIQIIGAKENNLKNINVKIPLERLVCVSGVSGSGKSTLINDILANALLKEFYKSKVVVGEHKELRGLEEIDKVVVIDQSPIGRTPRSNPATYTGIFMIIRDIFAKTRESVSRGFKAGKFSFNVKGGRCEECEGQGLKKIEMYFLPDVYIECEECHGTRFNKNVLEIEYKGKNISDVLNMSIDEAIKFFSNIPALYGKLKLIFDVGLGYMKLGQPAPTLSGGEAQRVKLATELSKKETGKTLYILDEPTTGLHFEDINKLLGILRKLTDKDNTVLVIEHNLDVLANADWIIDLGPDGGDKGGEIIAEGTPRDVAKSKKSRTGRYLAEKLGKK